MPDLAANDLLGGATVETILARLHPVQELEDALAGAAHVQENTPEDVALKRKVFARLDAASPADAVLASSTSAILPSAFTEHLAGRARCLVVHPINPPYLIPAVEIVPAPWTDPAVTERAAEFLRAAGHAPIVMKREIDGFVMNRLQGALLEEAFRLVADGYASVDDVDIGIRDGLALRWSFIGPFETIDLNAPAGVRDYVERYQKIYAGIFPSAMRRVDWSGPVLETVEAERRQRVPAERTRATPGLARPATDGAGRAQAAGRERYRAIGGDGNGFATQGLRPPRALAGFPIHTSCFRNTRPSS